MAGRLERWRILRRVSLLKGYLTVVVICINTPHSYSQGGFLSIDCGNSQTNYTDSNKLEWVADDGTYIETGKSSEQLFLDSSVDRPLRSFRYFPESRSKYCYELPTPNFTYLIRPSFYMNESELNARRPFEFIVSVDANDWFIVKSGDKSDKNLFVVQEAIFNFDPLTISVCLQPVKGVPFISSLEMRSINDSTSYHYSGFYYQYLALSIRYNLGATSTAPDVRYPDDVYDRIWKAPPEADAFPIISSREPLDNTSNVNPNVTYVPPKVMQDGWKFQPDASDYATFPVYADGPQLSLISPGDFAYVTAYSEYLNASTSNWYSLYVLLGGSDVQCNFSRASSAGALPSVFPGSDALNVSLILQDINDNFAVIPDGPTLNAIEIFSQITYNFSLTNNDDDQVIEEMKNGFSLKDWQGDPCVPVPYDWLSCYSIESHGASPIYVTSIYLSNLTRSHFRNVYNASSHSRLHWLDEMSITESEVDSPTFELLISYSSAMLSTSNFSYNAITYLPTTWGNTSERLVVIDLSHNQLVGSMSPLNAWVQRSSQSLQQLNVSHNNLSGTFNSSLYFLGLPKIVLLNFDQNSIEGTLNLSAWYQAMQEASTNTSKTITLQLFSFVNNSISDIFPSAEILASPIQNLLKETITFSTKGIFTGKKDHRDLNWEMLLNICLGVARGLSYLHEELQPAIIHRDIKPENILLDKDFKPKIADFGLARHFFGETTEAQYTQISRIAGTRGYFAPEYLMHGQLSEKADVYSYGILVLEVVCGRKCIDLSLPVEEKILIDWVGSMRKKNSLLAILQPELRAIVLKQKCFEPLILVYYAHTMIQEGGHQCLK